MYLSKLEDDHNFDFHKPINRHVIYSIKAPLLIPNW